MLSVCTCMCLHVKAKVTINYLPLMLSTFVLKYPSIHSFVQSFIGLFVYLGICVHMHANLCVYDQVGVLLCHSLLIIIYAGFSPEPGALILTRLEASKPPWS